MITFTIANQKGGVGKTTTAINLAHGLAIRGKKVLIIDLDTQGNTGDSLGLEQGNELFTIIALGNFLPSHLIQARDNLYVIRSDNSTQRLKILLGGMEFRERVLSTLLDNLPLSFDYVFFDCAPSVDILQTSALVASDFLVIPTKLDQFSVKGIDTILGSLNTINKSSGGNCKLGGIIPTMFDLTTKESLGQLKNLAEALGPYVWPCIPIDTKVREANRLGLTLWELSPKPRALQGLGTLGGGYQANIDKLLILERAIKR